MAFCIEREANARETSPAIPDPCGNAGSLKKANILRQGGRGILVLAWRSKLDTFANDKSEGAYRDFTSRVIRFLAEQFSRYFPNVPVLPRPR